MSSDHPDDMRLPWFSRKPGPRRSRGPKEPGPQDLRDKKASFKTNSIFDTRPPSGVLIDPAQGETHHLATNPFAWFLQSEVFASSCLPPAPATDTRGTSKAANKRLFSAGHQPAMT